MIGLEINGADQYASLSARLRVAGERGLQRELQQALTAASGPARQNVLDHLPVYLPNRYADDLESQFKMRASGRGGSAAAVRIKGAATGPYGPRFVWALNKGKLRHPLFGDRGHWYSQDVYPGFFTQPLQDSAPEVRKELVAAMDRVAAQIAG